jgi:gluconokinase
VQVVVGLDAGTTSTKAVTAGTDAVVRDRAGRGYPLLVPAPGRAELDPHAVVAAALTALADVVARSRDRGDQVVAVCLSAALHGLLPLDGGGRPLGPLTTWADDRAAAQAAALHRDGRAPGLHARTGTPVHPMSPLCRLSWHREHAPHPGRWGGVKELLLGALCGSAHEVDLSCASATGLLHLAGRRWDDEALDVAGVRPDQLADVRSPTDTGRVLLPEVARTVGLPTGVPVVVGAGDGPLANLGSGAVRPGVGALSVGTSAALRAVVPAPRSAPALFCYALTDDHWVVGGAVNGGGSVVRWASLALAGAAADDPRADDVDAALLAEAAAVPPGSDGLLCLPHLLGERAPWWRDGLTGAYLGLRRDHRRAHLVRAAVEGVAQQLALVLAELPEVGELRASGGALAAPLWRSALAAALAVPLRPAPADASALGAALLGWHALGGLDLDATADLVPAGPPLPVDPVAAAASRRTRDLHGRTALLLADLLDAEA